RALGLFVVWHPNPVSSKSTMFSSWITNNSMEINVTLAIMYYTLMLIRVYGKKPFYVTIWLFFILFYICSVGFGICDYHLNHRD
ncbi:MAG: hypothetical protein WCF01_10070, partial [Nitrososphaeraceae archaeon]